MPYRSLKLQPQNVSTFEDCNCVRASGHSNKSVSQETEVKISGDISDADFKPSLYIHIPFCISKCTYCDFFSVPVREVADDYVDALCNEIRFRLGENSLVSQSGDVIRENSVSNMNGAACGGGGVKTVYIGGGTPSLLTPLQIKKITDTIYDSFSVGCPQTACSDEKKSSQSICSGGEIHACSDEKSRISEFTFEVNPDDVTAELLDALSDCGVTRISCGIQSLNDDVLRFCKRRANRVQVLAALDLFEKNWNGELSLDLISGLPCETEKSFLEGLEIVTATKANHISLYSLSIEEDTPLGKMVYAGDSSSCMGDNGMNGETCSIGKLAYDFDAADKMWLLGRDFLKTKGFEQYEVSNFCKNGKVSLHNLSYWNHESYIGCGSGGCGTKYNDDGTAFRWTNTTDLRKYIDFWGKLSDRGMPPKLPNQRDKLTSSKQSVLIENLTAPKQPVQIPNNAIHYSNIPQSTEFLSRETEIFEYFMMGLRKLSGVNKRDFEKTFAIPFPEQIESLFKKWAGNGDAIFSNGNYALTEKGILFLNKFLENLGCCDFLR